MANNYSEKRIYKVKVTIFNDEEFKKAIEKLRKELRGSCNRTYYRSELILENDYTITVRTISRHEAYNVFSCITSFEEWDVKLESEIKK